MDIPKNQVNGRLPGVPRGRFTVDLRYDPESDAFYLRVDHDKDSEFWLEIGITEQQLEDAVDEYELETGEDSEDEEEDGWCDKCGDPLDTKCTDGTRFCPNCDGPCPGGHE